MKVNRKTTSKDTISSLLYQSSLTSSEFFRFNRVPDGKTVFALKVSLDGGQMLRERVRWSTIMRLLMGEVEVVEQLRLLRR